MGVMAWGVSILALVVLLIILGFLERLRRRLRKAHRAGLPISGASFDEFTAFFYGTKRHELDQRATHSMMREEEGDGAPPNGVDLDENVVIMKPRDTEK